MLLVKDLPNIAVAAREDPPLPSLIELPLLNVLGDVLPIRPQGVPDVDGNVIAMQVQQRYIEIEPYLWLCIIVESDFGAQAGLGKGIGFREEKDAHYKQRAKGHYRTKRSGLFDSFIRLRFHNIYLLLSTPRNCAIQFRFPSQANEKLIGEYLLHRFAELNKASMKCVAFVVHRAGRRFRLIDG